MCTWGKKRSWEEQDKIEEDWFVQNIEEYFEQWLCIGATRGIRNIINVQSCRHIHALRSINKSKWENCGLEWEDTNPSEGRD